MKISSLLFSTTFLAVVLSGAAQAQSITPHQAYQDALAKCKQLPAAEQHNCRRDAGAAYQQAKKQPAQPVDEEIFNQNRLLRCQSLPKERREECIMQMSVTEDTKIFGSVEGGGILRETTITTVGEPYQPQQTAPVEASPRTRPVIR